MSSRVVSVDAEVAVANLVRVAAVNAVVVATVLTRSISGSSSSSIRDMSRMLSRMPTSGLWRRASTMPMSSRRGMARSTRAIKARRVTLGRRALSRRRRSGTVITNAVTSAIRAEDCRQSLVVGTGLAEWRAGGPRP